MTKLPRRGMRLCVPSPFLSGQFKEYPLLSYKPKTMDQTNLDRNVIALPHTDGKTKLLFNNIYLMAIDMKEKNAHSCDLAACHNVASQLHSLIVVNDINEFTKKACGNCKSPCFPLAHLGPQGRERAPASTVSDDFLNPFLRRPFEMFEKIWLKFPRNAIHSTSSGEYVIGSPCTNVNPEPRVHGIATDRSVLARLNHSKFSRLGSWAYSSETINQWHSYLIGSWFISIRSTFHQEFTCGQLEAVFIARCVSRHEYPD
ncbi:hypothetical protein V8C42DRAFT_82422 [Trichoderma barbatum]